MSKIALTITEAVQVSSISRTVLYEAFKAGKIVPRKQGSRTLILRDDLERYIRSLPVADLAEAA